MIAFLYSPPCDAAAPVAGGTAGGGISSGHRSPGRGNAMLADGDSPFSFLAWIDRSMAAELGSDDRLAMQTSLQAMDGQPAANLQPQPACSPAAGVPDGALALLSSCGSRFADPQTPVSPNLPDTNGGQGRQPPLIATDPAAASETSVQGPIAAGPAAMDLSIAAADRIQPETLASGQPSPNVSVETVSPDAPQPVVDASRGADRTPVVSDQNRTPTPGAPLSDAVPSAGTEIRPSGGPQPQPPHSVEPWQGAPPLPAHPPTRQTAALSAALMGSAHGEPADVGVPSRLGANPSETIMAGAVHAPYHQPRQSARGNRFDGQFDRAESVSVKRADSETMPTLTDPATASAKRHVSPEQPFETPDRIHRDATNWPAPNGVGSSAAEPNQTNVSPDSGKSAAVDLQAPVTDKQLASLSGGPDKADTPSVRAFQTTVMDQVVNKAALRTINGRSEIQIQLKPDFLGSVQMTVAGDKEQMMVRILTDQPMVKEIIETHLHQLKAELHHQGLTIDRFEVVVRPDVDQQPNRDSLANNMNQQSSQHGRRQEREENPENSRRGNPDQAMEESPNRGGINYFA